ncbi:uncharacterized protein [Parasteatoda tepidariorum]|uniref:uncharacterized protein n=1 Tax=Parasteatoda tepidariorum TaxID=114398 RepID=UPI00077F9D4D|nr:uncharacterized protein LOC107455565 [Parasteatoda tepidariorum]XP_015928670.1 uncharacterized protein LOC107455565 [Parasteatoda tepidariorum]XP_042896422.1 uncharacterized protein LOC107455565 [Parasteatoda tepidariorum]XP_042896423.1 uncharacterized protein LOC107455565 [Parasteatoda tepidariorum]
MSKFKHYFRVIRFKYLGSLKRLATCYNTVTILLIGMIVLAIVYQEFDSDKEIPVSKLDEFMPATYGKETIKSTLNPKHLTSKTTFDIDKVQSIKVQPKSTPLFKKKEEDIVDGSLKNPPLQKLPVIKLKYVAKNPRFKVKTKEEKFITPKKLTYKDIFGRLAHPRLFPNPTQTVHKQENVVRTSLNDWIQANNPRDQYKFLVYSAYWDDRFDQNNNVRIMAVMVTKHPPPVFCRLQMADGKTIDARVVKKVMNEHWRLKYCSLFISCEVAKNTPSPLRVIVSINRNFTFSAMLPVHQNKEDVVSPRGDIAVCVKPLHYNYDRATWLLEFIEFHRQLGVEHFFFYNHTVGPNVDAVLRYYITQGSVTILPWTLPVKSQKEIRTEAIFSSLNDCVFRTMYFFRYVIMLDFDEYIIPREHETYMDMLHQLEEDNKHIRGRPGSFVFKNVFFYLYWENDTTVYGAEPEKPPQWVPYLITQYKTRRLSTSMKIGSRSKYIVVPDRIIEVGNHVVWRHTSGSRAISVQDTVALLHHYRICEFGGFSCLKKDSVVDRTATKFGPDLLQRVTRSCRLIFSDRDGTCPLSPPLGSPW